jgi:hypothetical protein
MNVQGNRKGSALTITMLMAGIAVITVFAAIIVGLLPAPSPQRAVTAPVKRSATGSGDRQRLSNALLIPLKAAQDALNSKHYSDAITILEAVNHGKVKSPYDQHVINDFFWRAYVPLKNYEAAVTVQEAELGDGFLKPAEIQVMTVAVAFLNYQVKNYDKAIDFGSRAMRLGSTNPALATMVAQAYYLKGDWDGTRRLEETIVNNQVAAGTMPDKASLQLWASACIKLGDTGCERQAIEKLAAYYPSPENQRVLEDLRTAH